MLAHTRWSPAAVHTNQRAAAPGRPAGVMTPTDARPASAVVRPPASRRRPTMDPNELMTQARDALTVKRVFGEPYERDGVTLIPAAVVRGGAGGGQGEGYGGRRSPRLGRRRRVRPGGEACWRLRHRRGPRTLAAGRRRQPHRARRPDRGRRRVARPARRSSASSMIRLVRRRCGPSPALGWSAQRK